MPVRRILALILLVLLPLPVRRLLLPTTLLPSTARRLILLIPKNENGNPKALGSPERSSYSLSKELNKHNRDRASVPSMEAVLNAPRSWMTSKRTTRIGMHRERVEEEVDVDMDAEANAIVHALMHMLVWAWTASATLLFVWRPILSFPTLLVPHPRYRLPSSYTAASRVSCLVSYLFYPVPSTQSTPLTPPHRHHPTPRVPPSRHIHRLRGCRNYKYKTVDDAQAQAGEEQSGEDGDVDMEGRDGDEEVGFSSFIAYFLCWVDRCGGGNEKEMGGGVLVRARRLKRDFDELRCRARAGAGVRHAFCRDAASFVHGQAIGGRASAVRRAWILRFRFEHPAHAHLACSLNTGMDVARIFCAHSGALRVCAVCTRAGLLDVCGSRVPSMTRTARRDSGTVCLAMPAPGSTSLCRGVPSCWERTHECLGFGGGAGRVDGGGTTWMCHGLPDLRVACVHVGQDGTLRTALGAWDNYDEDGGLPCPYGMPSTRTSTGAGECFAHPQLACTRVFIHSWVRCARRAGRDAVVSSSLWGDWAALFWRSWPSSASRREVSYDLRGHN
ncbi:hypothetical protein B0H14DRAFT_2576215 [Mycena olivaceomarginata]|nr:hypothetical protein B0H14DRAFT_2576215 [Mycena olivaceomarginata]